MARAPHEVVLVSSGLGNHFGGIGVVSQAIYTALAIDHRVSVWRHPAGLPRAARVLALGAQAFFGALRRPRFVFYEHVHLASLHRKVPQLATVPYGIFLHGAELWKDLDDERREALLSARILVANSETTIKLTRQKNPWLPPAEVTWLGISLPATRVVAADRPPNACIVGRMARAELKGHDLIFDAWPRIRISVPDARLFVIGSGDDEDRLRERVVSERLGGVEFLGYVSDAQRDAVFCNSRAFLFPSTQEGFGLAAVEAASWCVPVIGVAGTVLDELFPAGGVEFLSELRPDLIADATIRLLTDGDLATKVGLTGRQRVEECFREEQFLARFRETLAPVLQ